jgi:hypothetical protein
MRPVRLCLASSLALLALLACKPVKSADGLVAGIRLDRTACVPGDRVHLWITFSNPTDDSINLLFGCDPIWTVTVRNMIGVAVLEIPQVWEECMTQLDLAPGASETDSVWVTLPSDRLTMLPGLCRVCGGLLGYDRPNAEKLITVTWPADR